MEFAKRQLEKYGWKDGEGLGKNKGGISTAIKPKLKFDKAGLGENVYDDLNNTWWQRLYNEAAKNLVTKKDSNDQVVLEVVDDSLEITTKRKKSKRKKNETAVDDSKYNNFVKTSELHNNKEKRVKDEPECDVEEDQSERKKQKMTSGICDLTDEELFRVCGGRTVHKGARHGLKMNAKLARIEQQESDLCKNNTNNEIDKSSEKKKVKKHKKKKHSE